MRFAKTLKGVAGFWAITCGYELYAAPVILGIENNSTFDISQYMTRMQTRIDKSIETNPPVMPSKSNVDVDKALMRLTNAQFPITPGAIRLRGNDNSYPIDTHLIDLPINKDICVIGTDDYSVYWVSKVIQQYPSIKFCFVIEVEDQITLDKWRSTLKDIQIYPINGRVLNEMHGVKFYPVILEASNGN